MSCSEVSRSPLRARSRVAWAGARVADIPQVRARDGKLVGAGGRRRAPCPTEAVTARGVSQLPAIGSLLHARCCSLPGVAPPQARFLEGRPKNGESVGNANLVSEDSWCRAPSDMSRQSREARPPARPSGPLPREALETPDLGALAEVRELRDSRIPATFAGFCLGTLGSGSTPALHHRLGGSGS